MLRNREYTEVDDPRSLSGGGLEMVNPWYTPDDDHILPALPAKLVKRGRDLVTGGQAIRDASERAMQKRYPYVTKAYWRFTGLTRPQTKAEKTVVCWWLGRRALEQEQIVKFVSAGVADWQRAALKGIKRNGRK